MTTHEVTISYDAAGWYSRCIGNCTCSWHTEIEGTIREVREQALAHVGRDGTIVRQNAHIGEDGTIVPQTPEEAGFWDLMRSREYYMRNR